MVKRPADMNAFEFVALSALRAVQLQRGCTPRVVECGKVGMTAQSEVAERKVLRLRDSAEPLSESNAGSVLPPKGTDGVQS